MRHNPTRNNNPVVKKMKQPTEDKKETEKKKLTYTTMQNFKTKVKKVKYYDEELCQLEMCHNLIKNVQPNPEQEIK